MCVYSMIADHYIDKWKPVPIVPIAPYPTETEINELRKLLERAKKYDADNNQPECELEEKKAKLKQLAKELLGIDITLP